MRKKNLMTKVCLCLGIICFLIGYYVGIKNLKECPVEREKTGYEILQEGLKRLEEFNND